MGKREEIPIFAKKKVFYHAKIALNHGRIGKLEE